MIKFFKLIYRGWMKFAYVLGEINMRIIFTLLFFVAIGIYAIIQKIIFALRKKPTATSNWRDKAQVEPTLENLKRQF